MTEQGRLKIEAEQAVEQGKGLVKKATGKILDRDDLVEEGERQLKDADPGAVERDTRSHEDDRGGGVTGGERSGREF